MVLARGVDRGTHNTLLPHPPRSSHPLREAVIFPACEIDVELNYPIIKIILLILVRFYTNVFKARLRAIYFDFNYSYRVLIARNNFYNGSFCILHSRVCLLSVTTMQDKRFSFLRYSLSLYLQHCPFIDCTLSF